MKKIGFILVAVAAVFTACNKAPESPDSISGNITISPLLTRASDTSFDNGDRIGLTIIKNTDGEGETFVENSPMEFADNEFTGNLQWYSESDVASTFIAYYPYDASGTPATFSVQTDQSKGTSSSDFIIGIEENITPTASAVGMTFRHVFSKIVIDMTNDTGSDITSVVLSGSKTTADINVAESAVSVSASSEAANVTAYEAVNDESYSAILVPQEVSLTLVVNTADSEEYTQKLELSSLAQGGMHRVTARISEESGLQVKVAGEIEDWTDEGEIGPGGDDQPDESTIEYGGVTYKTVTLSNGQTWMAEPLRYVPDGMTVSNDPADDNAHIWYPYELTNEGEITAINATGASALTDEASIAEYGYLYDMYAALGGIEITADNCYNYEGAQGICPDGWHIPTRAEYLALCGYANKLSDEESDTVDDTAIFFDDSYNGGKISLFDEGGWNFVRSGFRQKNNFNATGQYSRIQLYPKNTSLEDQYGTQAMTYILASTCYKPITNSDGELTNIQYYGMMTTFTNQYPEGRVTVGYTSICNGQQLRCIKDAE